MIQLKKYIPFVIMALLAFNGVMMIISCASPQTVLERCMSMSKNKGLINDKGVDSSFLTKCERYHRKEVIDEMKIIKLIPKMIISRKNGAVIARDKDGKIIYIKALAIPRKAYLLYIDKGSTDGIE